MNFSWTTSIDKLMLWTANKWVKYEQKFGKLVLRVHCNQLLITMENKVLESFNMNGKMKGVYKDDVLILIVSVTGQEIRKLKFQLVSNAKRTLDILGNYFPVTGHNNNNGCKFIPVKYLKLEEAVTNALSLKDGVPMPEDYKNFIKLCLLDPTFPQMVAETEKILQTEFGNK